jgi:bacterioferritin
MGTAQAARKSLREGSANCLQGSKQVSGKKETMKDEHGGKGKGKDQNSFLTDITEIRRRARQHIEDGAVTDGYKGDRKTVLRVLNEALATEIVCVLRYKRHHYMARGIHSQAVAEEFLEHAAEEQEHADLIAERITQLDGEPNFNPDGLLTRSHSEYVEGESLIDMIREDLIAERIAVESYSEIIRYLADNDPTSRRLMESILAKEEEHAEEMKTLLEAIAREEKQEDRAQAS